jgi:hypothetical protein
MADLEGIPTPGYFLILYNIHKLNALFYCTLRYHLEPAMSLDL